MLNIKSMKNTELKPTAILPDLFKACLKTHNSKPCYALKRIGKKPYTCQYQYFNKHPDFLPSLHTQ